MKNRVILPICLLLTLAFPAWGAVLLSEGFDGMEKGMLPKGWECSVKTPEYYTNEKTYPTQPCLTLGTDGMWVSTRTFAPGVTNVSFTSYTANDQGACNKFQVNGWGGGKWTEIALLDGMASKTHQTFSVPVADGEISRIQIVFVNRSYNASLDDVLVEGPFALMSDHEDGFTLPEGTADTITVWAVYDFATPETEFAYAWHSDLEARENKLHIPADLAPGSYVASCTATVVGDEETSTSGSISFRVLEYHDIAVEESAHGTVTADAERAVEGTTVKLTAEAESEEYVLASIAINGEKLPRDTLEFEMPDTDVVVTAVFKKHEEGDLVVTFDDNTSKNPAYASAGFLARCLAEDNVVSNQFDALFCQGGGEGSSGLGMRVKHEGKGASITNGYFATADELEHPIARISFDYKAGSASHANRSWALETSTDGAHWSNLVTVATQTDWETCDVAEGIPENSFYFRIISANSGTTARLADFDTINIWWGEATYRVKLSGVKHDSRVVCDEENPLVLTAEGLDGVGPYEYAWTVNGEAAGGGETCTFDETGDYEVEVECTDDEGAKAYASVHFTLARKYKVSCPEPVDGCAIVASTNRAFAGDTVTVEAKPKRGYTLDGEIVATCDGEPVEIADGAFVMPEGDVEIAGTFRPVRAAATLPFAWHGPWQAVTNSTVDGLLANKLGTDADDKNLDAEGNGAAKFDKDASWIQICFDSPADELSFMTRGSSLSECVCTVFLVQESADGTNWTDVAVYESEHDSPPNNDTLAETYPLGGDSRFVRFGYKDMSKGAGNVLVDAIVITKGPDEEPETVSAMLADGGLSFADGQATLNVTVEPDVAIEEGDIWTTTNLETTAWAPADGATVEKSEGKYVIKIPQAPGMLFISVGKPITLKE